MALAASQDLCQKQHTVSLQRPGADLGGACRSPKSGMEGTDQSMDDCRKVSAGVNFKLLHPAFMWINYVCTCLALCHCHQVLAILCVNFVVATFCKLPLLLCTQFLVMLALLYMGL
jgi:hypothetical protein